MVFTKRSRGLSVMFTDNFNQSAKVIGTALKYAAIVLVSLITYIAGLLATKRFMHRGFSALRATAASLLVASTLTMAPTAASAQAINCGTEGPGTGSGYATTGSGAYKPNIFWLDWSCGATTEFPANSVITKSWTDVGGLVVTATITNGTVAIKPYNTGDYFGDYLNDFYSRPNRLDLNPLGLTNVNNAEDPNFDIAVTATVGGTTIPVSLVVGDAESTDSVVEGQVWTTTGQPWQVFDRFDANGSYQVQFDTSGQQLTLSENPGNSAANQSLVALAIGAQNINVVVNSGGFNAVGLGVFVGFDHGDLPANYPETEGHFVTQDFSGSSRPTSATSVNNLTLGTLSTVNTPFFIGSSPTVDLGDQTSATAAVDVDDGITLPAFTAGIAAPVAVNLTGAGGFLQGWIDWNQDGDFDDADERVMTDVTLSSGTTGSLAQIVTPPADALGGTTFARFRYSSVSNLNATARAPNGEVEDYAVTVAALVVAGDDGTPTAAAGDGDVLDVLTNDTINGVLATLATSDVSVVTPAVSPTGKPVPTLSPATGMVSVPGGTPDGLYQIEYQLCDQGQTTGCDTAIASVRVSTPTPAGYCSPNTSFTSNIKTKIFGNASTSLLSVGDIFVVEDATTDTDGNNIDMRVEVTASDGAGTPNLASGQTLLLNSVALDETANLNDAYVVLKIGFVADGSLSPTSTTGTPVGVTNFVFEVNDIDSSREDRNLADVGGYLNSSTSIPDFVKLTNVVERPFTDATLTNATTYTMDPSAVANPDDGNLTDYFGEGNNSGGDNFLQMNFSTFTSFQIVHGVTGFDNTSSNRGAGYSFCATVAPNPAPAVEIVKSISGIADTNGNGLVGDSGDTITYAFAVENTGNTTLGSITVTDAQVTFTTDTIVSLARDLTDSTTVTGTHVITPTEYGERVVQNSATVTGTQLDGNGDVVNDASGQPITVTDISDAGTDPDINPANANNAPDAVADPAAVNTPDKDGNTTPDFGDDPTLLTLPESESDISVIKSLVSVADTNGNGITDAGDTATYDFVVRNTGSTALAGITISDPKIGLVNAAATPAALPANTSDTAVLSGQTYVLTVDDAALGFVENTAVAIGTPVGTTAGNVPDPTDVLTDASGAPLVKPTDTSDSGTRPGTGGDTVTNPETVETFDGSGNAGSATNDDPTVALVAPVARIEVVKTIVSVADTNGNGVTDATDVITYAFAVTNTGNTILADVGIADSIASVVVTGAPVTLQPGETNTAAFTATYPITAANVTAGGVENTATATGNAVRPDGTPVKNPADPAADLTASDVSDSGTTPELDSDGNPIAQPDPNTTDTPNLSGVTDGDPTNDPTLLSIPNPQITLVKSVSNVPDTNSDGLFGGEGDIVTFSFVVRNTGNTALTGVTIADSMIMANGGTVALPISGGPIDLAIGAGDSATFTASYTVTAADLTRGFIENTATATGTAAQADGTPLFGPTGTPLEVTDVSDAGTEGQQVTVPNPEDEETPNGDPSVPPNGDPTDDPTVQFLPGNPNPQITLVKSVASIADTNGSGLVDAGDTITYAFAVTNTGNVRLGNVTVDDPRANPIAGGPVTLELAQSDTTTFTASAVLTAAEAAAGAIVNTATTTGGAVNSAGNPISDPATGVQLTAEDTSDSGTEPEIGVTGVPTLIPDPEGEGPGPDDPTTLNLPKPEITLEKAVASVADTNNNGATDAGDVVTYAFTVTNSGDTALANIVVADPLPGLTFTTPATIAALAIGASDTTVRATYSLTPADIAAGFVENTATATGDAVGSDGDPLGDPFNPGSPLRVTDTSDAGTDPDGTPIANPPGVETPNGDPSIPPDGDPTNDPTVFKITPKPSLQLTKSIASITDVNGNSLTDAGDTVNYVFTVTNTGNVAIAGTTVSDPLVTVAGGPVDLAIGASDSTTFTAAYTLLDVDVTSGVLENTAEATGTAVDGSGVPIDDPANPGTPLTPTDTSDSGTTPELDNTGTPIPVSDPEGTDTPDGSSVTDGDPGNDPTVLKIDRPEISLIKSVSLVPDTNNDGLFGGEGDVLVYSFVVRNTGNVDLTNVTVTDALIPVAGGPIDLAVGAGDSVTFTGTYTVTAADIARTYVENTATATGDGVNPDGSPIYGPDGTPISVSDVSDAGTQGKQEDVPDPEAEETPNGDPSVPPDGDPMNDPTVQIVPSNPKAEIVLVKSIAGIADTNGSGVIDAGDTVNYTFSVTNTGNIRLAGVVIDDPRANPVTGGPITLELGQTDATTFTASAVITADEATGGLIENTAIATGGAVNSVGTPITVGGVQLTATDTSDSGTEPEIGVTGTPTPIPDPEGEGPGPDDPTQLVLPTPQIVLEKSVGSVADNNNNGSVDAGDVVSYTFDVTNTGNADLVDITVTDLLPGLRFTTPVTIASLAQGATNSSVMATYALTVADVAAGFVENTAEATGTAVDDSGTPFGDPFNPGQPLTVSDTSDAGTDPEGNDVPNPPTAENPPTGLPGATPPNGIPDDDPTVFLITPKPEIQLTKLIASITDVNTNGLTDAGDLVNYTFSVQNVGNVAMNDVRVSDPLVSVSGGPITLAIGATDTASFTATYTVTAADVAAGGLENTARVIGTAVDAAGNQVTNPNNPASPLTVEDISDSGTNPDLDDAGNPTPVPNPETTETPDLNEETDNDPTNDPTVLSITRPEISLIKSVANVFDTNDDGLFGGEGDEVVYSFLIRNTGNVDLTNVMITDSLAPVTGGPIDLAIGAGDSVTFAASYTVTAADLARGYVENTATVTGDTVDPSGNPVYGPDGTPISVSDVSDAGTQGKQEDVPDPEGEETPNGDPSVPPDGDPTNDPTVQVLASNPKPSLMVVKSITQVEDTNNSGFTDAGDTVTYRFRVTNNGNVRLADVTLDDPRAPVTGGPITLELGQTDTRTFRASAIITEAEVTAGAIENTATATGGAVTSAGDPVNDPDTGEQLTAEDVSDTGTEPDIDATGRPPLIDDPEATGTGGDDPTVLSLPNPEIDLVKSVMRVVDTNGDGLFGSAGDVIEYSFVVTNTGNTALSNVTIADVNATISGGPIANLAVGASDTTTFTGTHTIIRAEFNAGFVQNTATVTGTPANDNGDPLRGPDGSPLEVEDVSDTGTNDQGDDVPTPLATETPDGSDGTDGDPTNDPTVISIPTNPKPEIALVKSIDSVADTNDDFVTGAAGDVVTYRFDVTNTGNTDLQNVEVNDPLLGGLIATIPALAQDATTAVFANYTILEDDELAGFVQNTATTTGLSVNRFGDPLLDGDGTQITASDVSDTGTVPDGTVIADPAASETPDGSSVTDADPTNDPTVVNVPFRPSDLLVSGTVFLDRNGDGDLNPGDDPFAGAGYIVILRNADGEEVGRAITAADGTYSIGGFPLGNDYQVEFQTSDGRTVGFSEPFDMTRANPTRTDVNRPIDPSGVIYNSTTGDPVAGVTVQLTDASGTPLPAICLGAGQQPQITLADGAYNFDVNVGADPACPLMETEYLIEITDVPAIFDPGVSVLIPPQTGSVQQTDCTSGGVSVDAVAGGSCQLSADLTAPDPADPTPYFFSFLIEGGDPDSINNHIPIDLLGTVAPTGLSVAKVVTGNITSVVIGEAVPYTITVTNPTAVSFGPTNLVDVLPLGMVFLPGSAEVDGVATVPTIAGDRLIFDGLTIAPTSILTITLVARVGVQAPVGELTNSAFAADPVTDLPVSNIATATVIRRPEAVFDCSDVIGKVFDDRNANGYQDDPTQSGGYSSGLLTEESTFIGKDDKLATIEDDRTEPGLPHVRLVTQSGTIITTDEFGRFSVPCAELPGKLGANFGLKLDERSLPSGYRVTTENPRVMRLTRGIMTEMNFGASISRVIDVDLTAAAFNAGTTEPSDQLEAGILGLLGQINDTPSIIRIAYFHDGEERRAIRARVNAVEALIQKRWKSIGKYKLVVERTIKRMQ